MSCHISGKMIHKDLLSDELIGVNLTPYEGYNVSNVSPPFLLLWRAAEADVLSINPSSLF